MKYAFCGGKLLDGTREMQPREGLVLRTDGDRITDIVPEGTDLTGYEVVDLKGGGKPQKKQRDNEKLVKTILSTGLTRKVAYGMVAGFAKEELFSGVTTIRTVGGLADFDTRLRDDIRAGRRVGPRILAANEGISVPGGHMAGSVAVAAHTIDEALAQLEKGRQQGVDLVKLMITGGVLDAKEKGVPGELKMPPEMVKVVCERAHEMGYTVAAHVESPEGVRVALENGVDSIEHGAKPDADILRLFRERGAFLCTTISPALPYALFDRSVSNASEVEQYNGNVVFEGIIDCAKDFWRELYYFHKYVGVSNAFALYTATGRSAQLAGIDQETGTLEPGKAADLIVTAADPLADLRALRHVELVMSHGQLHRAPQVKHRKNVEAELDRFL